MYEMRYVYVVRWSKGYVTTEKLEFDNWKFIIDSS